ncbi:MAG: ATP-binding protein [Balneolaceae bacterium]
MKFSFGSKWLEDRSEVIGMMRSVLDRDVSSDQYLQHYHAGVTLFKEGEPLDDIYILLEGSVQLYKLKPYTDQEFPVSRLQPGALIGIIAFTTHYPSLTTAKTETEVSLLQIPREELKSLFKKYPEIQEYLDQVILANLLERYRQSIILKMKLDSVNQELKNERNELKKLYEDLKDAQNKLIYQEKMATLGQLVAGFAHEVNNPTAALVGSVESLETRIQDLIENEEPDAKLKKLGIKFYMEGKKTGFPDTKAIRNRMKEIEPDFPDISRNTLRILSQVSDELLIDLKKQKVFDKELLDMCTSYFEIGRLFRNISSSGNRIANLVKSLKSYSRNDAEEETEIIDIREGIKDTLQLTSNRIKFYDVELKLNDIPKIEANPAALNQVWTNIILNAADAMGKFGKLKIECRQEDGFIRVDICDTGPGIEESMLEKIFEPNVTTKHTGAKFGLGLGLAISKNIIEQHDGSIIASNAENGGACFTVRIPESLNNPD